MTTLNVEVLGENNLMDVLATASDGAMADTFICNVCWDDGQVRRSFVKRYTVDKKIAVVNEITGYIVANGCDLTIPERIGIIAAPDECFLSFGNSGDDYHEWCVVVSAAHGKTPNSFYPHDLAQCEALIDVLAGWSKLSDAISFDDWVANQDRNLGNFVIQSKDKIYLIDHSNLPVTLNWSESQLVATREYRNVLVEILDYFKHMPLPIKSSISKATGQHATVYQEVKKDLDHWWEQLFDDTDDEQSRKDSLDSFLTQRANLGTSRVAKTYQMLVS